MTAPLQALVLDFGGVISKTPFETHRESERALGLAPGTLTWRGPFDPETDPLWRAMQREELSERDYWRQRARETGALLGESWNSVAQFLRRARANDPAAAIRPEAIAAITRTKAAGLKVGILSNELDLFYGPEFKTRLPFIALIDALIDGTYTDILKPDARAYELAAEALGVPPSACLMVDDQPRNVTGAQAAGMDALPFDVIRPAECYARVLTRLGIPDKEASHG